MTIMGIGPILAVLGIATAVAIVFFERLTGFGISLPSPWKEWGVIAGIALLVAGVFFWLSAALTVKRAFESHRLATGGVFRVSRNPMYAGFIVFIFPGLALVINDILVILISLVMFAAFKARIAREESYLAKEFGEDYERYRKSVPQLVPFIHL